MKRIAAVKLARTVAQTLLALSIAAICPICCDAQANSLSLPATTVNTGTFIYQARTTITNTSTFTVGPSASVTFTAGTQITLMPGFQATAGSATYAFHAVINPSEQTAPPTISTQNLPPSSAKKDYIFMNGKVVAIENKP